MKQLKYQIIGESMPCVEIELDCQQSVIAEAGAMTYFEDGIGLEVQLTDGSDEKQSTMGKLFSAAKRMIIDESLFITHFTNNSNFSKKHVSFSAPFPGQIIPLDLQALGGTVYCQKNAFLCATLGTSLSIAFSKKVGAGFFGGEGFVLQKIEGQELAFIHGGGTIIERDLQSEVLYIETGCLVAFSSGIDYDIEATTSIRSILFSGEGLYLTKLSGTGRVWIQTMPFNRLAGVMFDAIQSKIEKSIKKAAKKSSRK
jgi:uncharacterized protein (TIGR00266 family)